MDKEIKLAVAKPTKPINPIQLTGRARRKSKKFVTYGGQLYYNHFEQVNGFGRIMTAQGTNIVYAKIEKFGFPDIEKKFGNFDHLANGKKPVFLYAITKITGVMVECACGTLIQVDGDFDDEQAEFLKCVIKTECPVCGLSDEMTKNLYDTDKTLIKDIV